MERTRGEAGAPTPPTPAAAAAAGAGGGAAKGMSCKGCLFYSSVLRSRERGPVCVGITRALPQGYSRASPAALYSSLRLWARVSADPPRRSVQCPEAFSGLRTLRPCEWPVGYHSAATNRSPSLSQGKWEGQIHSTSVVSKCARKGVIIRTCRPWNIRILTYPIHQRRFKCKL